jgi:hypothetical protein
MIEKILRECFSRQSHLQQARIYRKLFYKIRNNQGSAKFADFGISLS